MKKWMKLFRFQNSWYTSLNITNAKYVIHNKIEYYESCVQKESIQTLYLSRQKNEQKTKLVLSHNKWYISIINGTFP